MAGRVLSLLMVLMTCSTISFSYPFGAPMSSCETMKPGHGVYPQPNPAPYIMKINASSYQYGSPITVNIMGPVYRGILLQARTHSSNTLYGTWLQPPSNTKILACPDNPFGSITHSNTNIKDEHATYVWMPPNSSCPHNLFFIATVAEAFDIYWLGVRSAVIYKDPTSTCSNNENTRLTSFSSGASGIAWRPVLYSIICLQLVLFLI
ncbi:putative defense protein 3 [Ranitomeya variabilis]|uniref:putative defense protein 3 n=1 Tax=Ranitomeya variabilis TaxID=490064 RepID=UPI0040562239